MKEEVKRILKLVQEGKISADDAVELIEAIEGPEAAAAQEATGEGQATPPPPPPGASTSPFKGLFDAIDKIGKDVSTSVDWNDVARQAKEGAQKGLDALRQSVDQIRKTGFPFGNEETKIVELPLIIPEGKTLRIDNPTGDVRILGGTETGEVVATARVRAATLEEARQKAATYVLMIEESDHQVTIRQPDMTGLTVDLSIKLLGSAPIELTSASGDLSLENNHAALRYTGRSGNVSVRGVHGPVEINTTSGDIRAEDVDSPSFVIENKSGDIRMTRVKGSVSARTASGDIRVEDADVKTLAVECVSGDATVDLRQPVTGAINVRTVSGDATVGVPDGSDCRVGISTVRGHAYCGINLEDEAKADNRITGRIGAGTGSLDVSAVTGDVSLQIRSLV